MNSNLIGRLGKQWTEMHREGLKGEEQVAFYLGALAVLNELLATITPEDESTNLLKFIRDLRGELDVYHQAVEQELKRRAART